MANAAVIVAAGRGTRAGPGLPKQWRMLAGRTVVARTLAAFREHSEIERVVLVLHTDDMGLATGYAAHGDVIVVAGGADRGGSVLAGLNALRDFAIENVLIHDVARPLVSGSLISRVLDALEYASGAAPGLAITDALWVGGNDRVAGMQDRKGLFRAQTPQAFNYTDILAAHHSHNGGANDDVEVARDAGIDVTIIAGEERNLKLTTAEDFARAEHILRGDMDIRVGNGFDVHRFGVGDRVTLCGVQVPHSHGLLGHSDADVGMHALTDAIYGALAMGDIGRHFPPSDPQWKGAASHIFLDHAATLMADRGFALSNADVTLVCELPKIGPHAVEMAQALSEILGVEPGRISVKATTSERLGFTGRKEGIAALATVALVSQ